MIDGLKPYPAYTDSGVEWLESLPERWGVRRAKYLFRSIDERSADGTEDLLTVSSERGVVPRKGANVTMFEAESYAGHKLCWAGDLVINSLWAWAGGLGFSDRHGIVSTAYGVYRPRYPGDADYLNLALRSGIYQWELMVRSRGIWTSRLQLTDTAFLDMPIVLPPNQDQAAIVHFLGHIDSRIQRLIKAKERLIELLEEERRAIIHRAVIRGLDRDVPLRSSGIEGWGDVPITWRTTRVKNEFLCLNNRRRPLSSTEREKRQGPYPYYGASGIIDHVDEYLFDEPLLLIAEDGANLVLRNLPLAIRAEGQFWVNNHAHILKPLRGDLEYLQAVLEALDYRPYISGAAQPKLTKDRLLAIPIAVPDQAEQAETLRRLNKLLRPQDEIRERALRQIALLRDFHTTLIADVVTGKLDVRGAAFMAAHEPDVELGERLEEAAA